MKNILTAAVFTVNLVCLQNLLQAFPAFAQSSQDLQIEETISLPESSDGAVEIPSVGGRQEEIADSETLLSSDVESDNTSEEEDIFFDISLPEEATRSSCSVNGFPLIVLCTRF